MKTLITIEEGFLFVLSLYLFQVLDAYPGWLYAVLFIVPDISMLGYLVNSRVGAISYNIAHHKAIAVALYLFGAYSANPLLQLIGLVFFGRSSFDRMLGYGLKYKDSMRHTHLGMLNRSSNE